MFTAEVMDDEDAMLDLIAEMMVESYGVSEMQVVGVDFKSGRAIERTYDVVAIERFEA